MVLDEARKREEGENAQNYGCIVGRAFFNFPPLPKLDGISTRLGQTSRGDIPRGGWGESLGREFDSGYGNSTEPVRSWVE